MAKAAASVALSFMVSTSVDVAPVMAKGDTTTAHLPEVKYAVPTPVKRSDTTSTAAAPKPAAAPKAAAPKPVKSAPVAAAKSSVSSGARGFSDRPEAAPAVAAAPAKNAVVKSVPVPITNNSAAKPESGKTAKADLVEVKYEVPKASKGGKGMVLNNDKARPKSKLAAFGAAGAGLGAAFTFGKAAGVGAAKGGAAKAAAGASSADVAEAAAVFVAGGAVGQTGTAVITKASRIRKIRKTPEGELPLPLQAAVALSIPGGFVIALLGVLANL